MPVALLALLLASACLPEVRPDCVSGEFVVYGADCAAVDVATGRAMAALSTYVEGWSFEEIERQAFGASLTIGEGNGFESECSTRSIGLDALEPGILAHEIAHLTDSCSTPRHEGWVPRHIWDAVIAARDGPP